MPVGAVKVNCISEALGEKFTMLSGPLPGPKQTVNRGELLAVVRLLARIDSSMPGWTNVYTDSAYVWKGACDPCKPQLNGDNGDLWMQFYVLRDELHGRVLVSKVKAHCTQHHVDIGAISLHDWLGNDLADNLAGQAAKFCQVDEGEVRVLEMERGRMWKIRQRIVAASLASIELSGKELRPDKPTMQKTQVDGTLENGHCAVPYGHRGASRCTRCCRIIGHKGSKKWNKLKCVKPVWATCDVKHIGTEDLAFSEAVCAKPCIRGTAARVQGKVAHSLEDAENFDEFDFSGENGFQNK